MGLFWALLSSCFSFSDLSHYLEGKCIHHFPMPQLIDLTARKLCVVLIVNFLSCNFSHFPLPTASTLPLLTSAEEWIVFLFENCHLVDQECTGGNVGIGWNVRFCEIRQVARVKTSYKAFSEFPLHWKCTVWGIAIINMNKGTWFQEQDRRLLLVDYFICVEACLSKCL